MKKNTVIVIIVLLIVGKILDPISWSCIHYYGISFNDQRHEIGLLPVKVQYVAEWTKKYAALEFLPNSLEEQASFRYKRIVFDFFKIQTEVDVFKKMKSDSSELVHLYRSYDFVKKNHEYTYQVYLYDTSRKSYVLSTDYQLSQFAADSILNAWNK